MTRISTNQLFDRSIQSVLDNQSDISDLQQQLSSGKKLLRPSDDPVGAASVVRLTEEIDRIDQFKRNNDLLRNTLDQEEAILRNVNNAVDRARVLAIQAGNGIIGVQDRQAIAIEIGQIRDQVFDLMNSRDANGEYIFAGYQSQSPAFVFDPTATGNKYTFQGDDGINEVRVSDTVTLQSNSSGSEVFEDVLARLTATISATAGVTAPSLRVQEQAAFDRFFDANYDAVTAANNVFQAEVLAPGNQVQITNTGTGTVIGTQNFVSGQPFAFNGLEISFEGGVGDTLDFTLDPPVKKNFAETLNDFVIALEDENISDADYAEALQDVLVGIDNGQLQLANSTSSLGGRINVAQSVFESNLDLEISTKTARSVIEDVDYAEAVSDLSRQETALQAAQATFARVTGLSLFDFI